MTKPAARRAPETTVGGWWSNEILIAPDEIARGPAGDCCVYCGLVRFNLPLDHDCRPNIDVVAYRAQSKRVAEFLDGRWTS
jgi:hypothetical protein